MKTITPDSVQRGFEGASDAGSQAAPTRASVLLVDDQVARLLTYEAVLAGLEIQCVRALSGAEALHHLLQQEFAAILLDVHMPELDGFELAKMIRQHPRLERTPIIFVTGVYMSEFDRLRGYEVGAIDYISVPVVPEILRSKVAVLVELHLKRRELQALNRELEAVQARVEREHQRVLLEKESELVAERLRTVQSTQALRDSQERLLLAKTGARLGIFDWNLLTGAATWDERVHELWGTRPEDGIDHVTFIHGIHPEDREHTLRAMDRAMNPAGDGQYRCLHRVIHRRDQSVRWLETLGKVSFEAGQPVRFNGIVQDVTQRKDAEERLQLIGDHLPVLISYVDADRRYRFCNARYCEWFGGSKEAFVGQHAREVLGEEMYRERKHLIDRAMEGEFVSFEGPLRHRTLGVRRCDIAYVPHRQANGKVQGVYVMAQDITDRRRSEDRLRESEKRFRNMADHSPVMIWMTEPDGSCSYLNRRWYEFTGQRPSDGCSNDWLDAVHPEDRSRIEEEFVRSNAARMSFRLEYRLRHCSGRYQWVIDAAAPRFSDEGDFAGYIGSVIDIGERKVMEDALRESEGRFRELADAMPQIVFTAGPTGVTDYFNRKWYEMTGLPDGSTEDALWSSRLHPDDRERTLRQWYESVRTGEAYQIEYRFDFPEHGGYRWHLARALPVRDGAGKIVRWYGTCTDIHDLRMAQDALKQADRRKDEFLATLAHELRNPLAPIRSAIQFLQLQSPADPRLAHAGFIIDRQTQVMTRLVDDLLDLSRITRGRIALQRAPLQLQDVLTNAVEGSRAFIESQQQELIISAPAEPIFVDGDSTRLAQIFSNLLNNAAKFSQLRGRIEVTMARRDREVAIAFKDRGIGIPSDMLEAIFEMFTQVSAGIDRAHGGLGIGLTLARQLAELHGGRIEAHSDGIGRGSEFLVILPIIDREQGNASAGLSIVANGARRRVLIADDNIDAAQMLSYLLELSGFEVRTAADGPEALKIFEEYQPEIVLLDIGMPEMSGYEVAAALRARPGAECVLLVAVSGWGQESDRQASFAAGFDHHLTKPVSFDSLQTTLELHRHQ